MTIKPEKGVYIRKSHRVVMSGFIEGHHVIISYPTRGSKDNVGHVSICKPHRKHHTLHASIVYDKEMSHKNL